MTSNTGPILMFTRIQPLGSDKLSFLGKVYSRHVTGSVNCENSSVCFCHEVLSDFNCFQESCISTNLYHSILLWELFHSFLIKRVCWLEQCVGLSCQHGSPRSCLTSLAFITQIWDCSSKTELTNRNNCATNSFNRVPIGTEVYR